MARLDLQIRQVEVRRLEQPSSKMDASGPPRALAGKKETRYTVIAWALDYRSPGTRSRPERRVAGEARAAGFRGEANPPRFDSGEKESLPLHQIEYNSSGMYTDDEQQSIDAARGVLIEAIDTGLGVNDDVRERAAAAVHRAWLERHHPTRAEDLRPYDELSEGEKEKDRAFVRQAESELGTAAV